MTYFEPDTTDLNQLKILIVSTGKTGNTWLKNLLSVIYDLPMLELPLDFSQTTANNLGARWVSQQHYYPSFGLMEWVRLNNVVLVTTIRHPADTLISYYYHIRNFPTTFVTDKVMAPIIESANCKLDEAQIKAQMHYLAEKNFFQAFALSITWFWSTAAHVVRYEDLWHEPVETLANLCSKINEVPVDVIERAVESCDITILRGTAGSDSKFFRDGKIGSWVTTLLPETIELFKTVEPYPTQLKILGYTMEPSDPLLDPNLRKLPSKNPFRGVDYFDNGVKVSAILVKLYLSLDASITQRWQSVTDTSSSDSFWGWINSPAGVAANFVEATPFISNLAAYTYRQRADLRAAYPDLYGQNRLDFVLWFIQNAASSYQLDEVFIAPLRAAVLQWAMQPSPTDTCSSAVAPALSNLANYIYWQRSDLQAAFPDVYGQHRLDFLLWFASYGRFQYSFMANPDELIPPSFIEWANSTAYASYEIAGNNPPITNLAIYIYQSRADLQTAFPDLYGQNRNDYIKWFVSYATDNYKLNAIFIEPLLEAVAEIAFI